MQRNPATDKFGATPNHSYAHAPANTCHKLLPSAKYYLGQFEAWQYYWQPMGGASHRGECDTSYPLTGTGSFGGHIFLRCTFKTVADAQWW